MKCQKRIIISELKETYCMLEEGHTGECKAEIKKDVQIRCTATNPDVGVICGLPKNHGGKHQNGLLCRTW